MIYPRIRQMREAWNLPQKELAGLLNVDQRTYSHYELGTRNISVQALVALAKYYGVSVDYLLGLTDVKSYPKRVN